MKLTSKYTAAQKKEIYQMLKDGENLTDHESAVLEELRSEYEMNLEKTTVEYTNDGDSNDYNYVTLTIEGENAEKLMESFEAFTLYESVNVGADEGDSKYYEMFIQPKGGCDNKKEFMKSFRKEVREWKKTL